MSADNAGRAAARRSPARCASRRGQFWQLAGAARAPADRRRRRSRSRVLVVWLIAVAAGAADPARDAGRARPARRAMAADAAGRARERGPALGLAGAAGAGRRGAARRDRAARRQGQDRAPGRPRRAHLHRRAVRGLAQLARRGAQRGARAADRSAAAQGRGRLQRLDLDHPGGQPRDPQESAIASSGRRRSPSTGWSESTLAEQAWVEARGAAVRWAVAGAHRRRARRPGRCSRRPSWLASAIASATDGRARPRRRARHGLVRQRRRRARRRPGQPRRQLAARPARVDAGAALVRRRARGAPRLLPQRHDADRRSGPASAASARRCVPPHRLGRPVAERLARRPRHALEHAAARRQRPPALARRRRSSRSRAAGASTAASTSTSRAYRRA